jgi:hypothetical protein
MPAEQKAQNLSAKLEEHARHHGAGAQPTGHTRRLIVKIIKTLALASVIALGASFVSPAYAQGFGERFDNQWDRIDRGVDSGDLTRKEARRLKRNHREIRELKQDLAERGDGLSQKDRRIIRRKLNNQSNAIYDQRHDNQER